jgi:hypothetical protein
MRGVPVRASKGGAGGSETGEVRRETFEQVDWARFQAFIDAEKTRMTIRWLMLPDTDEDHLVAPRAKWFGHKMWWQTQRDRKTEYH